MFRNAPRSGRSRFVIRCAAAGSAVALSTLGVSLAASAAPVTSTSTSTSTHAVPAAAKPTIVLVHGAFADSSGWDGDIALLRKAGFPVIAATNPLRGLTSDSDYVRSIVRSISGPVILVGHSYGGAVITNAARGADNVKALVYVGAFMPDQGESIATELPASRFPGSLLGPDTLDVRTYPDTAAPGGQNADLYIKVSEFKSVFAGDISAFKAEQLALEQRPLSETAYTETSGTPAWKTLPTWDLVTLDDHAIPPAGQVWAAKRAKAHIETVHSAHDVMISHPGAVLKTILDAYRAEF